MNGIRTPVYSSRAVPRYQLRIIGQDAVYKDQSRRSAVLIHLINSVFKYWVKNSRSNLHV